MEGPAIARGVVTLGLAAAVLAPSLAPSGWDDFPVSTYPMFSRGDLGAEAELDHVLVTRADGTTEPAPPEVFGTPEVMVAMKVVSGAVGRGEARSLCARTLVSSRGRDERAGTASTRRVVSAAVVTSRFDTRRYLAAGARGALVARTVHATCGSEETAP